MHLPKARGDLSETLFESLRSGRSCVGARDAAPSDPEDAHIALWALYELHYRGFEDVDETFEWHPDVLTVRRDLEREFESQLRERYTSPTQISDEPFGDLLFEFIEDHDGASLAAFIRQRAGKDQALEMLRLRSIYHLKESDPVAWLVPRSSVPVKAALMELQFDEYGCGDPERLHAHMFADGLEASGLRPEYGAYIDDVPLEILEQNNAMSMFGLHRSMRGAALGHLAAFEATSSLPCRKIAQGLERLEFPQEMIAYYTEHVEADAVHEQLAVRAICGALVSEEPRLREDVFFGAFTCLDLEDRLAVTLLEEWADDAA